VINLTLYTSMKKLIKSCTLATVIFALMQAPVLADGYSPYGGHIPEDTGFADGMTFTVVAIAAYTVGLGFVILSRLIKSKAAKLS